LVASYILIGQGLAQSRRRLTRPLVSVLPHNPVRSQAKSAVHAHFRLRFLFRALTLTCELCDSMADGSARHISLFNFA
jgi:hypothetical protein